MIDANVSAGLERIASRERDVLGAYVPGFVPESTEAAAPSRGVPTSDPLCAVTTDDAWFVTDGGNGSVRFTRDGDFSLRDGRVCDADGRAILGFPGDDRSRVVPLRVDPIDLALGRVRDLRLERDGALAYTRTAFDPRTGARRSERVVAGHVAVARFPAATAPVRVDATGVALPAGIGARFGTPSDGGFAALAVHVRDGGRMEIVVGLERMREAYEEFEALRAANHTRGTFEKTTMDLLK